MGEGNIARNNKIHGSTHLAISLSGNEHLIEGNEIFDVLRDSDDASAIYSGGSWLASGNRIVNNYIHDVYSATTGNSAGVHAIYLDNCQSNMIIENNVISRIANYAFFINGGRNNKIRNNIVDSVGGELLVTSIGLEQDMTAFYNSLREVPYQSELWQSKYPELYNIAENEPTKPVGNSYRNNLSVASGGIDYMGIADSLLDAGNNYAKETDPGFVNYGERNFDQLAGTEIFKEIEGFKQISFSETGVISDKTAAYLGNGICIEVDNPLVYQNGKKEYLKDRKTAARKFSGNVMLPIEAVAEKIGLSYSFDTESAEIILSNEEKSVKIIIGTNITADGFKLCNDVIYDGETVYVPCEILSLIDVNTEKTDELIIIGAKQTNISQRLKEKIHTYLLEQLLFR